jgi:hypothetical protein
VPAFSLFAHIVNPMRCVQAVRRTAMVTVVVALLATNVLSITNTTVHDSLYDLLSHIPYEGLLNNSPTKKQRLLEADNQKLRKQNQELVSKLHVHRATLVRARTVSQNIAKRTAKNVAANVASIPGEAVPYLGNALVGAITIGDIIDGCATVRDVNEMLHILEADPIDDHESEVCGMKFPNADEALTDIKEDIGGTVYHAKERTEESARKLYEELGGTLHEIFN